jgi:hypothetical protein
LVAAIGAAALATVIVLFVSPRPASPRLSIAAPASSLRMGLVGYWPFEETAGSTVAHDRSGRGHDCVLHDLDPGRAWSDGAVGRALDLRHGGWLECPQPPLVAGRPAPDMTVMVRVKAPLDGDGHAAVVTREMGANHDDLFFFGFVADRLKISSRAWLGWITRPVPGAPDRWMHIAFTRRSGGPTRLFLEGIEVGRNEQGERMVTGSEPTPLMVGAGHVGFEGGAVRQHFAGLVDELAVYDRALQPDEIARAAAEQTPLTL